MGSSDQRRVWRSAVSRGREDVTQLTMRELDYAGVAGVGAAWGGDAATAPPVPRCEQPCMHIFTAAPNTHADP